MDLSCSIKFNFLPVDDPVWAMPLTGFCNFCFSGMQNFKGTRWDLMLISCDPEIMVSPVASFHGEPRACELI